MYLGEGNGNPLQCSCLENSMNREAGRAAIHGVAKSRPQLSNTHTHAHTYTHTHQIYIWHIFSISNIVVVVQSLRHVTLFATPCTATCQALLPSLSPRVCWNSCPLSQWCYPTISSSVATFSFCLPCFPSSGSFPMSQLFTSGGQSIGASASALSLLWIFRVGFLQDWLVWSPCCPSDS